MAAPLITLTPAMQQAILIGMQLALMQIQKETKGMTQKQLIEEYIPKQEARKKRWIKKIDTA